MGYLPTIGLEVHAQLQTVTKIFCGCRTAYGARPNTQICPVCLGLPGALPALNRRAVDLAARAALALDCTVHTVSVFARKHYFYPDLPKGYQISQHTRPLATDGRLNVTLDGETRWIGIERIHLEEDAGKSVHGDEGSETGVDFNRSGVPLIEIVTRPDIDSPALAAACFSRIREILVALGVNDGNMEEGSLRCDANVSVRATTDAPFGVRTETKNLNSFRYVQRAVRFEIERQAEQIDSGRAIEQETRLFDSATGRTYSMRGKEEAHDYRYFPEPDLLPLVLTSEQIDAIRADLPELPAQTRERLMSQYGLPAYDAGVLTQSPSLTAYFEAAAAASGNPKAASNWIMVEALGRLNAAGQMIDDLRITPDALGGLIRLIDSGTITGATAKTVFERMFEQGGRPEPIVEAEGLARVGDDDAIERLVSDAVAANPKPVAQYRAGRTQTLGFLVGQVMKASGGKADPEKVTAAIRRQLDSSDIN